MIVTATRFADYDVEVIDAEEEPFGWARHDRSTPNLWGPPAPARWFEEASHFAGVPVVEPPGDEDAVA